MATMTSAKATYKQREALRKFAGAWHAGYRIDPRTMRVLTRERWIVDGKVTPAGLAQIEMKNAPEVCPVTADVQQHTGELHYYDPLQAEHCADCAPTSCWTCDTRRARQS